MKHPVQSFRLHIGILLLCLLGAVAQLSIAASAAETTPQAVVSEFYAWYVRAVAKDEDPLHDEPATLKRYVSGALIVEIEKKLKSRDGLDADYFMQAQDYLDDWLDNISVSPAQIKGATATTAVYLGKSADKKYGLSVSLVNEQGAWKIRKVTRR
ncbi:MAG TPA: DUF3828 domain-containing protein [Xanthobacteraceae bacterium]|nr:DUF3828 domain-containing protein [Xanthobacteraceae bacterium]